MNALTTHSMTQYPGSSTAEMTVELAKMLALVAPITMSTEQQELWLRAAVDALEGISSREVAMVSMEVKRKITRQSQIVPEIANLVAERRKEANRPTAISGPPLPPPPPRQPGPPLNAKEIAEMPRWLREMGLRVGFLEKRDGKIIDVTA